MNRKLKLALAALLGFSAACSSVKRAPQQEGGASADSDPVAVTEPADRSRIVAMYGVRSPRADSVRLRRMEAQPDSLPPVAERPAGEEPSATH